MNEVFISYSARDAALAGSIGDALRARGVRTWTDRNLKAGDDWRAQIIAALKDAAIVAVLVTPSSLASEWVASEWTEALRRSQRVIAVLAGGARREDLPEPLSGGAPASLDEDFEAGIGQIVAAISELPKSEEPVPIGLVNVEAIVEQVVERRLTSFGVETRGSHRREVHDANLVFVVIAYSADMEPTYDAIGAAAKACRLDARRTKDEVGDFRITDRTLALIRAARLVVVDLSHESMNVYFELGYARGLDKTVVTIARTGAKRPFDVYDWTCTEYHDSRPLEGMLVERFKVELERGGAKDA